MLWVTLDEISKCVSRGGLSVTPARAEQRRGVCCGRCGQALGEPVLLAASLGPSRWRVAGLHPGAGSPSTSRSCSAPRFPAPSALRTRSGRHKSLCTLVVVLTSGPDGVFLIYLYFRTGQGRVARVICGCVSPPAPGLHSGRELCPMLVEDGVTQSQAARPGFLGGVLCRWRSR